MKRTLVLTAAAVLSFVSVASAQPKQDEQAKPRIKVIDMGKGEDVDGDVPTGELMPIGVRDGFKSTSLLRIRHDFIDMILKAAEDLS